MQKWGQLWPKRGLCTGCISNLDFKKFSRRMSDELFKPVSLQLDAEGADGHRKQKK